jgi:hypothetical protein
MISHQLLLTYHPLKMFKMSLTSSRFQSHLKVERPFKSCHNNLMTKTSTMMTTMTTMATMMTTMTTMTTMMRMTITTMRMKSRHLTKLLMNNTNSHQTLNLHQETYCHTTLTTTPKLEMEAKLHSEKYGHTSTQVHTSSQLKMIHILHTLSAKTTLILPLTKFNILQRLPQLMLMMGILTSLNLKNMEK